MSFTDASGNYTTASGTVSDAISKLAASVTPAAASKTYGAADPSLSGTLSGFVAADNVMASYSRIAGETVAGGPYPISATLSPTAVLGNYTITYGAANFTINKATPTVSGWPTASPITFGQSLALRRERRNGIASGQLCLDDFHCYAWNGHAVRECDLHRHRRN